MRIAFLTTQQISGSTVVGRVLPLAQELARQHEVSVLIHTSVATGSKTPLQTPGVNTRCLQFGRDPFIRTASGKKRLKGIALIGRLKLNAWLAAVELFRIKPDVIVVVKSLPESVLAAWIAKLIFLPKATFILDVDDFELTANELSSPLQRAAVHWAQRSGASIATHIIAATPFLQDYFKQLSPRTPITLIPTGYTSLPESTYSAANPTILYAGSVSMASGHRVDMLPDILARVRAHVPAVQMVIAGGGDDVGMLRTRFKAQKLTDAVRWSGRFEPRDVAALYARADVIIDPVDASITNRAKSSFRVVAAMALGVPVITSNVGIRAQLVPAAFHERFFAVAGNAEQYAEKVVAQLRAPLADTDRQALKQHAMRYTWDVLAKQYLDIIT